MAFFQNLFNQEFQGNWVMGDRQYSITFKCPANTSMDYQMAYNNGPWDLSSENILTLNYAWDVNFKNYAALPINISGSDPSNTTFSEVTFALNSNSIFAEMFVAESKNSTIFIKPKVGRIKKEIKLWISNTGAETKLRFNKKAGVAEMPMYFARHTIDNRFSFSDSAGQLILLDETNPNDQAIIEEAGFVVAEMKEDWELLGGRASGLFTFQKMTIDGSNRISQIIEYPAGAKVGDFARKINYAYSGSNTNPSQVTEVPHVLSVVDLITPP
jgi:hypothetical protein